MDAPMLIAGDSNVHRMKWIVPENGTSFTFLPVSGAIFVKDRRKFIRSLSGAMEKSHFQRIYLHLGSNDALVDQSLLFRHVVKTCDVIHEISPDTEIVICSVLPRDANQLLKDLTNSTTFIRFIEYRKVANLLTADGLHLSQASAKNCLECIVQDVLQHAEVKESASLEADPLSGPWPSLGTANTDDASLTKTFAAVVHELAAKNFMEKTKPIKLKEGPLNKKVCTCKKPRRPILGRKEPWEKAYSRTE
ncbi:hypothetical protein DPMN_074500 [Dreissena polymorpha]|uniref:Uncharacterized protein n=1 Tax=Dreissena polymorpha TaxID=45954 RepID=A0A9D4BNF6_DREPO|nr:hypothetical protein DPMN_074500 [Dreissena polymorpha]